jgi:hypothetical protein
MDLISRGKRPGSRGAEHSEGAVTSTVSVIADTPHNGEVAISIVRRCFQMIAGCCID